VRVLGVDPGLTRCGIGIVEKVGARHLSLISCGVIRTDVDAPLEQRLLQLHNELEAWIEEFNPDVIAVERVFSQLNVRTAMATGQAAGVALVIAARSGKLISMHTPSEVKAAVTGSGRADKKQVATMVTKILKLKEAPRPVDTTDALALAICHHWRGAGAKKIAVAAAKERSRIKAIRSKGAK